jgi:hypothetical protein
VLAFVADGVPALPAADSLLARCPDGWVARDLGVDLGGVRMLS